MNQTPNYQLNQWDAEDKVLRTDFNADNAKIDAALKAEADTREKAVAALTKTRNCCAYLSSYVGTGLSGPDYPSSLTFPSKPFIVSITGKFDYDLLIAYGQTITSNGHNNSRNVSITWNGNTMTWYEMRGSMGMSPGYQCNESNQTYYVFAILEA